MMTCPICGAHNDPSNRFCDQCGARLDTANTPGETGSDAASPAPATISCPACGAPALQGQAFCDNCGYDLRTMGSPAETPPAEAAPVSPPPAPGDGGTVVTPPSSEEAEQPAPPAPEPASPPPAAPALQDDETMLAPPAPDEAVPPVSQDDETMLAPPAPDEAVPPVSQDDETMLAPPAPDEPPTEAQERQRLEEEVARHRKTVEQMEQMLQSYPVGAARPEFLTQGLEGARRSLEQAQAKLSSLVPESAPPHTAERERLEGLIKVHHDTITQFENMKANYPEEGVPSFLIDGINEAKRALTKAEADLAALEGGPSATPPPAAPEKADLHPPAPAPGSRPTRAGPRLELFEGKHEFLLPTDKSEIIVGREDPVSYIFPEVDLTAVGGEAGGVSRQHARFNHTGEEWTITDLNSTNHTRVDGVKIEPNTPTPVKDGTRIQFGRIVAILRL